MPGVNELTDTLGTHTPCSKRGEDGGEGIYGPRPSPKEFFATSSSDRDSFQLQAGVEKEKQVVSGSSVTVDIIGCLHRKTGVDISVGDRRRRKKKRVPLSGQSKADERSEGMYKGRVVTVKTSTVAGLCP